MQLFALSLGVGNRKQDVDEEETLPPTSCGSIVRCHQSVMSGKHLCIQLPESALFGPRHRTGRAQHLGHRGRHHTGHPESLIALQREQQDGRLQLPYLYERLKSGKRSLCTGSRRERNMGCEFTVCGLRLNERDAPVVRSDRQDARSGHLRERNIRLSAE